MNCYPKRGGAGQDPLPSSRTSRRYTVARTMAIKDTLPWREARAEGAEGYFVRTSPLVQRLDTLRNGASSPTAQCQYGSLRAMGNTPGTQPQGIVSGGSAVQHALALCDHQALTTAQSKPGAHEEDEGWTQ